MPQALLDKRCLIVGGTSGLGLAAARLFLTAGARLAVAGLPDDLLDAASAELAIPALPCDATQPAEVEALFAQVLARLGGLDVLFHVAGRSGRSLGDGPLHACSDLGWRETLQANLTSVFLTNRSAVRLFLSQGGGGAILNMASILALRPSPRFFDTIAYTTAKGGIIAFSQLAAASYASQGIRVNVLAPGLIDTPMAARATSDDTICQYLAAKQPLWGGPGKPEDCAAAALFLCGDQAKQITGVVLPVDGAWAVS